MLMSSTTSGCSLAKFKMKLSISGSGWYVEWKVESGKDIFQLVEFVRLVAWAGSKSSTGKSWNGNWMGGGVEFEGK